MHFLTLGEVYRIQQRALVEKGGMPGVRDAGAVESAVAQPEMAFGGEELYPTLAEKAAALAFSLVKNTPSRTPTSAWDTPPWKLFW